MRIYVVSKNPIILTNNNIFTNEDDAELCALQLGEEYKVSSFYVNEQYLIQEKWLWRVIICNNSNINDISTDRIIGKPEKELVRYNSDRDCYIFLIPAYTYKEAIDRAIEQYKIIEDKNNENKYSFLKEKLISKKTDWYHKGNPYKHPMYELGTHNIVLLDEEYINYAVLTKEQSDILSRFNIVYLK